MLKLRVFRIYSADIGGFIYFDISLLSNYISFSIKQIIRCYDDIRVRNSLQNGVPLVYLEKKHGDPQIFSCIILLGRRTNN
jgi:hypothetical protein